MNKIMTTAIHKQPINYKNNTSWKSLNMRFPEWIKISCRHFFKRKAETWFFETRTGNIQASSVEPLDVVYSWEI